MNMQTKEYDGMEIAEVTSVLALPRGGRVLYHSGFLACDRDAKSQYCADKSVAGKVNQTAETAHSLFIKGLIDLVQSRVGFCKYEYYAVRK